MTEKYFVVNTNIIIDLLGELIKGLTRRLPSQLEVVVSDQPEGGGQTHTAILQISRLAAVAGSDLYRWQFGGKALEWDDCKPTAEMTYSISYDWGTGRGEMSIRPSESPEEETGDSESPAPRLRPVDAPMCMQCGVEMLRAGSGFACPSCGDVSGCN